MRPPITKPVDFDRYLRGQKAIGEVTGDPPLVLTGTYERTPGSRRRRAILAWIGWTFAGAFYGGAAVGYLHLLLADHRALPWASVVFAALHLALVYLRRKQIANGER